MGITTKAQDIARVAPKGTGNYFGSQRANSIRNDSELHFTVYNKDLPLKQTIQWQYLIRTYKASPTFADLMTTLCSANENIRKWMVLSDLAEIVETTRQIMYKKTGTYLQWNEIIPSKPDFDSLSPAAMREISSRLQLADLQSAMVKGKQQQTDIETTSDVDGDDGYRSMLLESRQRQLEELQTKQRSKEYKEQQQLDSWLNDLERQSEEYNAKLGQQWNTLFQTLGVDLPDTITNVAIPQQQPSVETTSQPPVVVGELAKTDKDIATDTLLAIVNRLQSHLDRSDIIGWTSEEKQHLTNAMAELKAIVVS